MLTARQAMADGTAGISLVDPEAVHKPEQRAKAVGAFVYGKIEIEQIGS